MYSNGALMMKDIKMMKKWCEGQSEKWAVGGSPEVGGFGAGMDSSWKRDAGRMRAVLVHLAIWANLNYVVETPCAW